MSIFAERILDMNRIAALLFLMILLIVSCAEKPQTPVSTEPKAVEDQAPKEKWLKVDYDDVRVRDAAGMDGKILATLKQGTKIKDLEIQSDFETTVKLRGEEKTAPWMKIETAQGTVGWIFGGTVSSAEAPKKGEISNVDFSAELKKMDKKNCACLDQAIQSFQKTFQGHPKDVIDKEIPTLLDYLQDATNTFNDELVGRSYYDDFYLINYNPDGKPLAKGMREDLLRYEKCGMKMIFVEGSAMLIVEPGLVLDKLNAMLSTEMRRYLGQMKVEDEKIWADDGGLTIPVQAVADRAIFWEKFATDLPNFVLVENAKDKVKTYTGTLMGGLDNTPAFDFSEKRKLQPEYKKVYEWLMEKHPNTKTGKVIREYYMLLKETGFSSNDKARNYLERFWQ